MHHYPDSVSGTEGECWERRSANAICVRRIRGDRCSFARSAVRPLGLTLSDRHCEKQESPKQVSPECVRGIVSVCGLHRHGTYGRQMPLDCRPRTPATTWPPLYTVFAAGLPATRSCEWRLGSVAPFSSCPNRSGTYRTSATTPALMPVSPGWTQPRLGEITHPYGSCIRSC